MKHTCGKVHEAYEWYLVNIVKVKISIKKQNIFDIPKAPWVSLPNHNSYSSLSKRQQLLWLLNWSFPVDVYLVFLFLKLYKENYTFFFLLISTLVRFTNVVVHICSFFVAVYIPLRDYILLYLYILFIDFWVVSSVLSL